MVEVRVVFEGVEPAADDVNRAIVKDLADKTRRGLRGRVEAGASGGGLCYGYDVVSGPAGEGRGQRRINEAEAAVVRRIFRDFANGLSPKRIALALNGESISGPSGAAWSPSTIYGNHERGTGILNNELYIGRLVWNRLRYLKDPNTGKRVSRLNAPDLWVVSEVPDLRIVDQDLWDAVKRRQASVRTVGADTGKATAVALWDRRRPRYLFSGLMVCGRCGGGYSKISANLFGCSTARNKGPTACTNLLNIRRDVLEETVLAGLRERLLDPTLFKVFAEEFTTAVNRQRRDESRRIDDLRAEETSIARRIAKLVSAIADGLPARSVRDELMRLEARQDELAALIAAAPEALPPLLHPNLPEVYRRKVAHLHTLLEHPDTKAEAMDLIRSLVEAIVLTPEDGTLRVDLRGELAAILGLCADSKKPGAVSGAGLLEQVMMVAGAGFEPATFRL